jgi:hypothetical protein
MGPARHQRIEAGQDQRADIAGKAHVPCIRPTPHIAQAIPKRRSLRSPNGTSNPGRHKFVDTGRAEGQNFRQRQSPGKERSSSAFQVACKGTKMRDLVLAVPCALFMAVPALVLAQEASGHINVQANGVSADWAVVASPPRNTLNQDDESQQSVFAYQSGEFGGVVALVMWATPMSRTKAACCQSRGHSKCNFRS